MFAERLKVDNNSLLGKAIAKKLNIDKMFITIWRMKDKNDSNKIGMYGFNIFTTINSFSCEFKCNYNAKSNAIIDKKNQSVLLTSNDIEQLKLNELIHGNVKSNKNINDNNNEEYKQKPIRKNTEYNIDKHVINNNPKDDLQKKLLEMVKNGQITL